MPAPAPFLQCNRCGTILGAELVNQTQAKPCPHCRSRLLVWVFPAFFQPVPAGQVPEALGGGALEAGGAESSCFFHPRFRAAEFCALCGRFLCALCDLPHAGNHLCPDCLATQMRANWKTEAPSYDRIALLLAVLPLVAFFPLTILTAPAALLLVILSWNGVKNRPVKGSRSRLVVVALLALLEITGWAVLIAYVLMNRTPQGV